jgi:UDP:flavonoid glycosyltransferase YjiC (YdhE family)
MLIAILAMGSRGDVQPYVALGAGLVRAGHQVRLLSHENFQGMVQGSGMEFWPLRGDVEAVLKEGRFQDSLEKGDMLKILRLMQEETTRRGRDGIIDALPACEGAEMLIGGMSALGGGLALSEKFKIPFVQAYPFPFTPTKAFPSVAIAAGGAWPGAINWLTHFFTRQMFWLTLRGGDQVVRKEVLGLPQLPWWGPFGQMSKQRMPVLYGYSEHVLPRPADWPAYIDVTGFWFLDPPGDWVPPADLVDFLKAGPPPVYIGFGSMVTRDPEQTAALVLAALRRTGQRGVIQSGWGGLKPGDLPDNVFMAGNLLHSWLFPQMAAVVHHGGVGTTAAGLRAGVPSVIVPFFGDQPFWGNRVAALGVGPAPIPKARLTEERLAAAITRAVSDEGIRRRAQALGERIRAEDGVARAVAFIEKL